MGVHKGWGNGLVSWAPFVVRVASGRAQILYKCIRCAEEADDWRGIRELCLRFSLRNSAAFEAVICGTEAIRRAELSLFEMEEIANTHLSYDLFQLLDFPLKTLDISTQVISQLRYYSTY